MAAADTMGSNTSPARETATKSRWRKFTASQWTIGIGTVVIGGILLAAVLAGAHDVPNLFRGAPPPKAIGKFTYPVANAKVPTPQTIRAKGTVQQLEKGHHLLVFLQFGSEQKYLAGDPDVRVSRSGRWSGTVCVGGVRDSGTPITLYLVDINYKGLAALANPQTNYWSASGMKFPPTRLARGVTILNHVTLKAFPANTRCAVHEPNYYAPPG
jgi:hypothetical protein